MAVEAKYVHTNIVARDWRALVRFYQEVFGCTPVPPQRNYSGPWVGEVTAVAGARVEGMHLRLPGYGDGGPTLEIFQYDPIEEMRGAAANRRGFAHIAFHVEDVPEARRAVLAAGGSDLGRLHTMEVPDAGDITLVYMTDPEQNIVELQHWSRPI